MLAPVQRILFTLLALPLLVLGFGPAVRADTIYVCWDGSGDYLTIQEGIDAAADGDEVVVCDGTYTGPGNKDLDFAGQAIVVRSENGPETCIIDCEGDGRGFYFHSGETAEAVVEGFTITDGDASYGGALRCNNSNPTITNCTISGNSASEDGGAVYCSNSNPTITDCTISGNLAGNSAGDDGGAVYCYESNPTISNCTISDNSAGNDGGGVYCFRSSPTITNCRIAGNSAGDDGGGVCCIYKSSPTITNCTISGNSSAHCGGAIYCDRSGPAVSNSTIAYNSANYGGGVHCCYYSRPTITNSILWADQPKEIFVASGEVIATYSDIQGGWAGEGNIDEDPLFVADGPLGDYYLSQTAAGQEQDSPCVDAGSDTAENLGLNTRTTRTDQVPDSGIVDMGYHYPIVCLGDLNDDGDTDQADLGILLADWGCDDPVNGCAGDLNGDDKTDQADLGILLADWGCGT